MNKFIVYRLSFIGEPGLWRGDDKQPARGVS
jgi:hypothetical protein